MNSKVFIVQSKLESQKIKLALSVDPYQTRFSQYPVNFTYSGKPAVLSEIINEVDTGSRFAIECFDKKLLFISRVTNSSLGQIFMVVGEGTYKNDKEDPGNWIKQ